MTDLVHFENRYAQETLVKDSFLLSLVIQNVNTETGEIPRSKKTHKNGDAIYKGIYHHSEYKNLIINYTLKDKLVVKGSFHKYWNDGIHNHNDFSELQSKQTILSFCKLFGISLEKSILKGYEIGININLPFPVKLVLNNCFFHIGKKSEMRHDSDKGHYIQFEHSQYIVKIYDKSLQYQARGMDVEDNIMRFEIKFKKMEILNRMGIYTLRDLQNYDFKNFKDYILKKWDEVFMYDTTFNVQNPKEEKYQHVKTWREYLDNKTSSKLKYHRKKYNLLVPTQSRNTKKLIRNLMAEKIDLLTEKKTSFDYSSIGSTWSLKQTQNIDLHNLKSIF